MQKYNLTFIAAKINVNILDLTEAFNGSISTE